MNEIKPRPIEINQPDLKSEAKKYKMKKVGISMAGIQETEELLVALAKVASALKESFDDDGKLTISDATHFVTVIFPLIQGLGGINEVPAELADLDEVEKGTLVQAIKDNLILAENDEQAVEDGLAVLFALHKFLKTVGVIKPVAPDA